MVGVGNWRVINEDTTSEIDVYVNDLQVPTPDHSFTCYSISKVHVLVTQAGIKPLDIHVESFDV